MKDDDKKYFNSEENFDPKAEKKEPEERYGEEEDYSSPERYEQDKEALIDFLQYPREKRKLTEFAEDSYKALEGEAVERTINRIIHEHECELEGSTPYYKPGHIGSLMYEYLNMVGVESSFVSGLQHTKSSMTKSIQQRVDEINTLLRGVGGFNRQIKPSFSRSAVVYLEQEDPRFKHRERVIFTVNVGDFELRHPLDESAADKMTDDGRNLRRLVWDEAVNTLAEIISNTGMKPKYVKNDKNSCRLTMRQYLLTDETRTPDEYFQFELCYMNGEMKDKMANEYVETIEYYDKQIEGLEAKVKTEKGKKAKKYETELYSIKQDRSFYIGTHPDPREMDTGLLFSIFANTLKDYTITKDKMQVIMTKYILALSTIAVDKSLDQQLNTDYRNLSKDNEKASGTPSSGDKKIVIMKDDLLRKKAG